MSNNEKGRPAVAAAKASRWQACEQNQPHTYGETAGGRNPHRSEKRPRRPGLSVRIGEQSRMVTGREAQTLTLLIERGPVGFTSGEASPFQWARRTSAYIHGLRGVGVPILTQWETTGDGSRIGRYILAGPVTVEAAND